MLSTAITTASSSAAAAYSSAGVQVTNALTTFTRGALAKAVRERGLAALQEVLVSTSMTDSVRPTASVCSWRVKSAIPCLSVKTL